MSRASATLTCKITPNASRSECTGWSTDAQGRRVLLIRLAAPPVDGRANAELLRFLAGKLECSRSEIHLLRGNSSRLKALSVPADAIGKLD